jgi:hypothetical protein
MNVPAGPISLARPGWGLEEGSVTSLMADGASGHPDVLAAQIIFNAASSGMRVVLLLPGARGEDAVWPKLVHMLAGGDEQAAAKELLDMPVQMHLWGTGHDGCDRAHLVYAPGLSSRPLRRLGRSTNAPILVVGEDIDGGAIKRPARVVHVGATALRVGAEGFEIPVVYDPSGPMYRPA